MANKVFTLEIDEHTVLVCDDALHFANLMKKLEDKFGKEVGKYDVKQIQTKQ